MAKKTIEPTSRIFRLPGSADGTARITAASNAPRVAHSQLLGPAETKKMIHITYHPPGRC